MLALLLCAILAPTLALRSHAVEKRKYAPKPLSIGTTSQPRTYNGTTLNLTSTSPVQLAIGQNFADPYLVYYNSTWYAFATNNAYPFADVTDTNNDNINGRPNVQLATSPDFITWTVQSQSTNVLPKLGTWAVQGASAASPMAPRARVWAPGVYQRSLDQKWVMYYSALASGAGPKHCIGAAVSAGDNPAGPYTALDNYFSCPLDQGGAIDADPLVDDDGTTYVVYKVDGNACDAAGACGNPSPQLHNTPILLQKVTSDGVKLVGSAIKILDRRWSDGALVEAPTLIKSPQGVYFLFFSSGSTTDGSYTIKYATSFNITGPYVRCPTALMQTPWYGTYGPGSCGVAKSSTPGDYRIVFHSRLASGKFSIRAMFSAGLKFDGFVASLVVAGGPNSTSPLSPIPPQNISYSISSSSIPSLSSFTIDLGSHEHGSIGGYNQRSDNLLD